MTHVQLMILGLITSPIVAIGFGKVARMMDRTPPRPPTSSGPYTHEVRFSDGAPWCKVTRVRWWHRRARR